MAESEILFCSETVDALEQCEAATYFVPFSSDALVSFHSTSRLIEPLISTDAVSSLTNSVTEKYDADADYSGQPQPSRGHSAARYRRVLLTSLPLAMADVCAIGMAYAISTLATVFFLNTVHYSSTTTNLLALTLSYLLIGSLNQLFPATGSNPVRELRSQVTSITVAFVLLIGLNGLAGKVTIDEMFIIGVALPMAALLAPIARFATKRLCARWDWWGERVIIVGANKQGLEVYAFLKDHPQRGLKPLGIIDQHPSDFWEAESTGDMEFLGTTTELLSVANRMKCHWVIASIAGRDEDDVRTILTQGSLVPNLVVLNANLMMPTMWVNAFDAAGLTGIHIRDRLLFPFQRLFKRLTDVVLSASLLLLFSPLYLGLFFWIRRKSDGPVLFCHGRIGRSGQAFGAWKFRTMVPDAAGVLKDHLATDSSAKAEWEQFHKLKDDPRIIPGLGRFLRQTSLDELPQLWNVLIGDMSLVGPRPVYTRDEIDMYGDFFPLYLRMRPGLTGLWQVSGRNNTTFADKVQMDTYYSMNWSLWLDYFILLRTIRTLILREGSC